MHPLCGIQPTLWLPLLGLGEDVWEASLVVGCCGSYDAWWELRLC